MLGINHAPSSDPDSPALSASPPPAPAPRPPPVRNGCQRCRFNASVNSSLNRSHQHLTSSDSANNTLTRGSVHNSSLRGGGDGRNHIATSTGHLHTAGSTASNQVTVASTGHHAHNGTYPGGGGGSYDRGRLLEEEDSAYPALLERELHSLHRNVPALRRAGVDTTAIRQHFYPDGGWGWIVCGVAFLAHVLTTGFQLSYGLLLLYAIRHLGHEVNTEAGWLGAASWAMSLLAATVVVALCRRKSTRLTAVLGGLVMALGILFTSFATQLHQVAFSYGVIVGIGAAMVRESAAVMLGHYFKRRRQFVEMITMSGEGVGVALFSVILKEGVGKMGWRLGLQAVTGLVSFSFFMGLLYRPASLYHPQRRAILHLKNQRKKVKEKKTHVRTPKPPFLDFSPLKLPSVRMLSISAAVAAFGIYSPIFFLSLHGFAEGYDMQDLVLLQTFLGLSIALGIVFSGSSINKTLEVSFKKIRISRQYVCQGCVTLVSLSLLVLSAVADYRGLCFSAWAYGLGLGGYRYTLKMLAIERIRGKYFSKAWGFIKSAESLPVLFGVPLCAFLNDSSHRYGRAGYYICAASAAISAIILFFVGHPDGKNMKYSANGSITSRCTAPTSSSDCQHVLNRSFSSQRFNNQWYPNATTTSNNTNTHATNLSSSGGAAAASTAGTFPGGHRAQHHHHLLQQQHQLPQQRCLSTQFMNGGPGMFHSSMALADGGGGGGTTTGYNYHSPYCQSSANGRLHKSLSFAFQTPMMGNDEEPRVHHGYHQHQQHQQHQQQGATSSHLPQYPGEYPPSRCYSRCEIHNPTPSHQRDSLRRPPSAAAGPGTTSSQYFCTNGLQHNPSRSRSVPEGLANGGHQRGGGTGAGDCHHWNHCHWTTTNGVNFCRPTRPIQVVEQITTSV
uniref:Monocarboxylate transporter n=2 Tax=Culex quinquefasciatus TaxID=7176 RepID=A0A904MV87_CULQU